MVCCMAISLLFGVFLRPLLGLGKKPLAWRPTAQPRRASSRFASFGHAFAGVGFLIRNEPNMRIHLAIAAGAILAGIWLRVSFAEWRWLLLMIALVPMAEALNTGVEQVCNAVTRNHRPEIKAAKDAAAAGVLIAAIAAALIGASIFAPAILNLNDATPICRGKF